MSTITSSRTPEGESNHCPVCRTAMLVEPSEPARDATCPRCGHWVWFGRSQIVEGRHSAGVFQPSVFGQKVCTKFAPDVKLAVKDQVIWSLPAMRGRKPNRLVLHPDDKCNLSEISRSQTLPWFQVQRARIVLGTGRE